jgi:hypothetical protein
MKSGSELTGIGLAKFRRRKKGPVLPFTSPISIIHHARFSDKWKSGSDQKSDQRGTRTGVARPKPEKL